MAFSSLPCCLLKYFYSPCPLWLFLVSLYLSFSLLEKLLIWMIDKSAKTDKTGKFFGQMVLLGVDLWFISINVWVRNPGHKTICSSNPYNECGISSADHMFSIAVGTVK